MLVTPALYSGSVQAGASGLHQPWKDELSIMVTQRTAHAEIMVASATQIIPSVLCDKRCRGELEDRAAQKYLHTATAD
ncbi:hypothetical protein O9992_24895 [Vibrio lentus]|nr:hypothetical protein [Vibrio lentus]